MRQESLQEQLERLKREMAKDNGSHDMEDVETHLKDDWTTKLKRIVMPVDGVD